jgi:hypothetical protein
MRPAMRSAFNCAKKAIIGTYPATKVRRLSNIDDLAFNHEGVHARYAALNLEYSLQLLLRTHPRCDLVPNVLAGVRSLAASAPSLWVLMRLDVEIAMRKSKFEAAQPPKPKPPPPRPPRPPPPPPGP